MPSSDIPALHECFAGPPDPRVARRRRHNLFDIVAIVLLGMIAGADSWVDIELFGHTKEAWLRTSLGLPNGIPSHDTFGRVLAHIDPDAFRACFLKWAQRLRQATQNRQIAIDGKSVRHSYDHYLGQEPIQMVSAWATEGHLTLGQVKVDRKSNEITAIPELLESLGVAADRRRGHARDSLLHHEPARASETHTIGHAAALAHRRRATWGAHCGFP